MVGGLSSAGRAVALQASGHRFDPDRLHQASHGAPTKYPGMKQRNCCALSAWHVAVYEPQSVFDIVNGFFKSMPYRRWFQCGLRPARELAFRLIQAEINHPHQDEFYRSNSMEFDTALHCSAEFRVSL